MKKYVIFIFGVIISFIIFITGCTQKEKFNPVEPSNDCISLKEAEGIILSQILENNIDGKVIYELQTKMETDSIIKNGIITNGNEYTVKEDCWFFFIDDSPGGKYAHPCRYVFIYCNNKYKVIVEEWPPDNFDKLIEINF